MTSVACEQIVVGRKPTAGTPPAAPALRVRAALPADRAFIVSMLRGLVATLPVPWRHPRRLRAACIVIVESVLQRGRSDATVLVAERCDGAPVGIALLVPGSGGAAHRQHGMFVHTATGGDAQATQALEANAHGWAWSQGCVAWTVDAFVAAHPAIVFARRWALPHDKTE